MITFDDLFAVVQSTGLPCYNTRVARGDDVAPPFVIVTKSGGSNDGADDVVWAHTVEYDVDLYSEVRDYENEAAITDALDAAGIWWTDGGLWEIQTEGLVEAVFTVPVRE